MAKEKAVRRLRIKRSIRSKMQGTSEKPRLSVFRSNTAIYAQIIDDTQGVTIDAVSSRVLKIGNNVEAAKKVGEALAKSATDKGIKQVVFDRNGYLYHGRIKALADGAREGGLEF